MTVTINGTTGLATDSTSAVVEAVSLNHPSSSTAAITMDASNNVTLASNLTMTGGIYLGGTGSANLLDDVETGSWTPNFSTSGFTQSISSTSGFYTKVGRLVTVQWIASLASAGYMSSLSVVNNLPFTTYSSWSGTTGFYGSGNISGNGIGSSGYVDGNSTTLYLYQSISSVLTGSWRGTHTYFAA